MTGRKWTEAPQEAWLKKQFASFLQADSTATKKKFFANICTDWQKRFPDPEPSSDELTTAGGDCEAAINIKRKAKDKQIKAWFDNHKRPTLSGKIDMASSASRSVLNLGRQQAWQPWQAYADLKYKDWKSEIKVQFDALMKKWDEGHTEGEKKPLWFTFQNAFLKEKLEVESDEMKAKVEEHRLKMLELPPDEVNRQYQIAIDKLPLTFATIMDNIAQQTGWNITIMAGGPHPNDEGRITTLTYTTGKTKDGRDLKEFLGAQLELIEGPYDDFLHECFSADDCAARTLCDGERNEQVDDDDEQDREAKVDGTNEEIDSRDTTKKSKAKGKSKDVAEWKKSDYEIQREKNIAENRALLATIKGPEFEAAMGELKKGPALPRKKNKADKSKPDVEERQTSARLDRTSKSSDGNSASSGKDADPLLKPNKNADQVLKDTSEKPEVEATETPVDEVPAGVNENNNNKNNSDGSINALHHHDVPVDRALLPGIVDHDGDVTMNDGGGHLRDPEESHESLTRTPTSSIPNISANASPANASSVKASSVNETPALTTSSLSGVITDLPSQHPPTNASPATTSFVNATSINASVNETPTLTTSSSSGVVTDLPSQHPPANASPTSASFINATSINASINQSPALMIPCSSGVVVELPSQHLPATASSVNTSSTNETPAFITPSSSGVAADSPSQDPPAICITTTSQDSPALAGSASPTADGCPLLDGNIPGFLTPAIIAHLRGVSPTATWQGLVTAFLQFESVNPPIGKLSTTARPPEVTPWIKCHIHKKHNPVTVSGDYGARFRAWWIALQPSWRVTSSTSLSRATPPKETWGSLKKGGSAGLYIVVMALSWWVASWKTDSDNTQVMELVDDLSWVLSLVMPLAPPSTSNSASVKRRSPGSPDDEEQEAPPSKRVRT